MGKKVAKKIIKKEKIVKKAAKKVAKKKIVKKAVKKKTNNPSPVKAFPDFDDKAYQEERAVETLLKAEEIKQDATLMKGVNKRLAVQKKALAKISE